MTLTRDAILAKTDLARELVDVPEWGGNVFVREMRADERDAFEQLGLARGWNEPTKNGLAGFRAAMCAACVCDERGELIFGREHVEALGQVSASALNRVFEVAIKLNPLGASEVEGMRKN